MRQIRAKAIRSITASRKEYRAAKRYYTHLGTSRAQAPAPTIERTHKASVHNASKPIGWKMEPPILHKPVYSLHRVAKGSGAAAGWALRSALRELRPGMQLPRHTSVDRIAGSIPSHLLQSAVRRAQEILSKVMA